MLHYPRVGSRMFRGHGAEHAASSECLLHRPQLSRALPPLCRVYPLLPPLESRLPAHEPECLPFCVYTGPAESLGKRLF